MKRRKLIMAALAGSAAALVASGCGTTTSATTTKGPSTSTRAQRYADLDASVDTALNHLYSTAPGSRELVAKSRGTLVFPSVITAGLVVGGQYGQGALRVGGRPYGYYNIASASIGLQAGAQSKAIIFLFMTQEALDKFRQSDGWSVGADASVAVLQAGANGMIDVNTVKAPVVAFVVTNAGLMAGVSLEGTKITHLKE